MRSRVPGGLWSIEAALIYGVLAAGALVFAFPFAWMVATSFKQNRELAREHLALWPAAPRPRARSPYIDERTFARPPRPDGVPPAVWRAALPALQRRIADRLADWTPRTAPIDERIDRGWLDERAYADTMALGLLETIAERLPDTARGAALADARRRLGPEADGATAPSDRRLAAQLDAASVEAGVDAIVAAAETLLDEPTLRDLLDRCYRRFCLGPCRVRSDDYRILLLSPGGQWTVDAGPALLFESAGAEQRFQTARLEFGAGADAVAFQLDVDPPADADRIDRVYVSWRGDESWARVRFEVLRGGRRWRTREVQNLADRDWVETQLRWPGAAADPMARRTHLTLADAGPAEAAAPFVVRVLLTRNSRPLAWLDKGLYHYRTAFRELPFGRYVATSLALSMLCIVLSIFSCTLAAYAFARLSWPGRDMCFAIMLATMMIPPQVTMIPGFLIFRHLGWYNTLLPLWVPAAFGSAFFIFLLRQFLKTIPQDLEDAARIDGCGFLRIYWHVMLPLVTPTVAIIAIYTFIGTWNNFMGPLIYVNDDRLFPLALGLFKFSLRSGGDVGLMMAASLVMTMPVILLFFFVQRYFIQGITLTGLKG